MKIEHYIELQRQINSGVVWHLEGSAGRYAMDAIKAGYVMVGKEPRKDYWGSTVPSREMLQPGSFGTQEYVAERMGEDWADQMAAA